MGRAGRVFIAGAVVIVVLVGAATQSVFIVDETNQAIVTRVGEYQYTADEPGIYVKIPFVNAVHHVDRRLLSSDAAVQEYLTLDKKRLRVDHVTRWRIVDPLRFYVTVRTQAGARARLDDVVFSEMRRELASYPFDVVIAERREQIMENVARNAARQALSFGIQVEDVRIKRADLPSEVQNSVFERMKAERSREANRYRAEGDEQSAQIRAGADREKAVILADAYEESQKTRGDGEGQAIAIYAQALQQDPEFYSFQRRLESYSKILRAGDTLVLPSDSELFAYLTSSGRPAAQPAPNP
ncbi:MAG: protease modulator HflC [Chloroflexi bacterium]|nr:protease modulator HflC [Chloroflexota bacterium]